MAMRFKTLLKVVEACYFRSKEKIEISIDIIDERKETVYAIFLAILIFVASIYGTLRTGLLYDSRAADVNVYTYTRLADYSKGEETEAYKDIAREWLEFSEGFRKSANVRCYSGICCVWSLIFLIITLPVLFIKKRKFWLIPFTISIVFFILAFSVHILSLDHSFLYFLDKPLYPIIHPCELHSEKITKLIETHPWLLEKNLKNSEIGN